MNWLRKGTIPFPSHCREQFCKEQFQNVEADLAPKASGSWTFLSEILQIFSSEQAVA